MMTCRELCLLGEAGETPAGWQPRRDSDQVGVKEEGPENGCAKQETAQHPGCPRTVSRAVCTEDKSSRQNPGPSSLVPSLLAIKSK
jgi:hypothetical protein